MVVDAGQRQRLELPIARLPTETWVSMPLEVVNGARGGPRLCLSAAVHGDELNGVEIIRRVLLEVNPISLRGSIIAAPIINVFGFLNQSRYLPDRRDLNRSFPGSKRGSLASRLAHLFMTQVMQQCTHAVDLHTGSNHRANLPQIRANLSDPEILRCALAFKPPVMIDANVRDGSLREAATRHNVAILLYEAGEPMRFNPVAVDRGVEGIFRLMAALGMWRKPRLKKRPEPVHSSTTAWVRARRGGVARLTVKLGDLVTAKQVIGTVGDAIGGSHKSIIAPQDGMVIGLTLNPLVNQGDSLVHIAYE